MLMPPHNSELHLKSQLYAQLIYNIYGVATISRLLKVIRLFCRISSVVQGAFAKENYFLKEPANHSQPVVARYKQKTSEVQAKTFENDCL